MQIAYSRPNFNQANTLRGTQMSYGTVVKELARKLDRQIIAYDNLPQHGGCILYIDGPIRRIDIAIKALDEGASDVAAFVRQVLASPPANRKRIGIGVRDGELSLLSDEELVQQKKESAEAAA